MSTPKMRVSQFGLNLLKHLEGLRLTAYTDTQGHWTIGYGHLLSEASLGLKWTLARAAEQLELDTRIAAGAINTLVKVSLSQPEFDALASFVFNVGIGHFQASTLLKVLNAGDYEMAGEQILVWAKNPELKGRRATEHAIWIYGSSV